MIFLTVSKLRVMAQGYTALRSASRRDASSVRLRKSLRTESIMGDVEVECMARRQLVSALGVQWPERIVRVTSECIYFSKPAAGGLSEIVTDFIPFLEIDNVQLLGCTDECQAATRALKTPFQRPQNHILRPSGPRGTEADGSVRDRPFPTPERRP